MRFLALGLAFSACGPPPPPCAMATDCPAPLACDRGRCADPSQAPPPDVLAARRHRLPPVADVVVQRGGRAGRPVGPTDFLMVGGSGGAAAWRTYFRFNLEVLGPDPRVVRADLALFLRDDPPGLPRGHVLVGLHRVARPWSAASLTWRNQPGRSGPERAVARFPTARRLRVRIDVTEIVRDWTRGVHENFGFVLAARDEDADRRVVLYSSRSPDAEARPRLEVWLRGGR